MTQSHGRPTKYEDVKEIAERRGGPKVLPDGRRLRGHGLSPEGVEEVLREWRRTGRFVSPYTQGYRTDHLTALARLGVNQAHPLSEVVKQLRVVMESRKTYRGVSAWDSFSKNMRGMKPEQWLGRVEANFRSFRRLCSKGGFNPYGRKLQQIGCCVDMFYVRTKADPRKSVKYVRLNTHCAKPLVMRNLNSVEDIPPVDKTRRTLGPQD